MAQENNIVQLDLAELIQYLEKSVLAQAFNVITYKRS